MRRRWLRGSQETMQLLIDRQGSVRCLYSEALDLAVLGNLPFS
jgi:hypothetical protein